MLANTSIRLNRTKLSFSKLEELTQIGDVITVFILSTTLVSLGTPRFHLFAHFCYISNVILSSSWCSNESKRVFLCLLSDSYIFQKLWFNISSLRLLQLAATESIYRLMLCSDEILFS